MKKIKSYKIDVNCDGVNGTIGCNLVVDGKHMWFKVSNRDVCVSLRDTAPGFGVLHSYLEGGFMDYARVYALLLLSCTTALPDGQFINAVCAWGERMRERHNASTVEELSADDQAALQAVVHAQNEALTPDVMDKLIKEAEKELARAKAVGQAPQDSAEQPNNSTGNDRVAGQ